MTSSNTSNSITRRARARTTLRKYIVLISDNESFVLYTLPHSQRKLYLAIVVPPLNLYQNVKYSSIEVILPVQYYHNLKH